MKHLSTHDTVVAPRVGDIHLKTSLNVPLTMIPVIFLSLLLCVAVCVRHLTGNLNTSHLSKHCFKSAICFTQSSLASSCIPSHSSLYLGSHYSPTASSTLSLHNTIIIFFSFFFPFALTAQISRLLLLL